MPVRTTPAQVELIIKFDPEFAVEPFIDTAANLIDQVCLESGYSDATLELIERWLSAHFYSIGVPLAKSEGVRGVTEDYEGKWDLALHFTRYGQQAMLLDTAGNLAALNDMVIEGPDDGVGPGGSTPIRGVIMHIGGPLRSSYGCRPENLGD